MKSLITQRSNGKQWLRFYHVFKKVYLKWINVTKTFDWKLIYLEFIYKYFRSNIWIKNKLLRKTYLFYRKCRLNYRKEIWRTRNVKIQERFRVWKEVKQILKKYILRSLFFYVPSIFLNCFQTCLCFKTSLSSTQIIFCMLSALVPTDFGEQKRLTACK